jgi:hypothetical protein
MASKITVTGVGLVLLGAMLLVSPMFGFSTIEADRGVNVGTSGDDSAFLAINDAYKGSEITADESQPLVELGNNFDQPLGGENGAVYVAVDSVDGEDGDEFEENDFVMEGDPTIDSGSNPGIEFVCVDNEPQGKNTVDLTLRIVEVSGDTVSVESRVLDPVTDVEVQCNRGDPGTGDNGFKFEQSPESGGNELDNNELAFTVRSTLDMPVDVTAITIEVDSNNSPEAYELLEIETDDDLTEESGTFGVGEETPHDSYTIEPGQTAAYTVEFDERVNQNHVTVTLDTEDGAYPLEE